MKKNSNIASTVILSFDGYSDIWPIFFECFKRNWRLDFPTYLVTNQLKPDFDNVKNICVGREKSWSDRTRKAIKEVKSEYIILMLEDYFVTSVLENERIENLLSFMRNHNADYLRIYPFPKMRFKSENNNGIHQIPDNSLYGVNLQPSIWKRDYLLKVLGKENYSAWEFEARQKNGENTQIKGKNFTIDYKIFNMLNGVLQGKWYPNSVKKLKKIGINVNTYDRKILSKRKTLVYRLKIFIRKIISPKIIRKLKPFLKKFGFKFVTD